MDSFVFGLFIFREYNAITKNNGIFIINRFLISAVQISRHG